AFAAKLRVDRDQLEKELRETILIEKLELDVKSQDKATTKANDASLVHEYLIAFDTYLLPKITGLLEQVRKGAPQDVLDGLAHDFARGYHPYFTPNNHRSYFPMDVDFFTMAW